MMNDRIPYHEIRAYYTEDTIRVYQAYNRAIAEEAAKLGTFGKFFKKHMGISMVTKLVVLIRLSWRLWNQQNSTCY